MNISVPTLTGPVALSTEDSTTGSTEMTPSTSVPKARFCRALISEAARGKSGVRLVSRMFSPRLSPYSARSSGGQRQHGRGQHVEVVHGALRAEG